MNKEQLNIANEFLEFIHKSPTKYHAVNNIKSALLEQGYMPLSFNEKWKLTLHGKFFIEQDNAALIAFRMGENVIEKGIRLVCAHTDSPAFKEMKDADNYIQLNTQGYAQPILTTWFDKPLSIAGRVALKGKSPFTPNIRLVDLKSPLLLIPNRAFHLTEGKIGQSISKQKEMLPILGIADEGTDVEGLLKKMIAKKLQTIPDDILEYELYLYPYDKGQSVGMNADFILCPRQDDLAMVYAAHRALAEADDKNNTTQMFAFFDAEEETNSALGGADTPFFRNVLAKIVKSMNGDEEDMIKMQHNSFTVSLDVSFATHPNYKECGDPTCSPVINKGITIKYDANMHYATTALSSAVFQALCEKAGIPFQKETSHSDFRTGRTISSFLQTQVGMRCVEVGIPCWAMHSSQESCGTKDFYNLIRILIAFWNHPE